MNRWRSRARSGGTVRSVSDLAAFAAFTTFTTFILFMAPTAHALDSDRHQPATLEADDFELDLETGVRTYRGNVAFREGSIRLDCAQLVTYHDAAGELHKGVCSGAPGRFRQRPEGEDADLHGRALTITLDTRAQVVLFERRAEVEQARNQIQGDLIRYDLATEKVRVTGGGGVTADTGDDTASATAGQAGADGATEAADGAVEGEATTRPRLVIQPRKAKPDGS